MNKLFGRGRDRRSVSDDDELNSWLCDDRSYRNKPKSGPQTTQKSHACQRAEPTTTTPPPVLVIRYLWDRSYSQGLEFGRQVPAPASMKQLLPAVYWRPGSETSLGITLDVEATTRQIIVIHSTRRDIRAGSILVRVAGQPAREHNFHALLKAAKESRGITICLEFAPAPAPVIVKKPNYELAVLGVDKGSFELVAVDGCPVRYLTLQDIYQRIHHSSDSTELPTCEMVFERMSHYTQGQKCSSAGGGTSNDENNNRQNDSNAVVRGVQTAAIVTALAAAATIAGALS